MSSYSKRPTWRKVKSVRSILTFADVVTGNVVSRAGVELLDGKAGYISTRLKLEPAGRITDVELSVDTSSRIVTSYVWNLDPTFSEVLPPDQRLSRVDLEALARRYFHSLSTHVAVTADFDPRCNRFHSGQRITNVSQILWKAGRRGRAPVRSRHAALGPCDRAALSLSLTPERGSRVGGDALCTTRSCHKQRLQVRL